MTHRPGSDPIAFVLDINVFGGLGAVRSLGRAGVPVIGLGTDPRRFGFASRYCTPKQCPNPMSRPEDLVEFLLTEGRRLDGPGILLPASDEFVLFLAQYRDELCPLFRFSTPPDDLAVGISKRKQYDLAERLGVPYPRTFSPASLDAVRQIQDQIDYPAYIKPCYSHLWRARFPHYGKGVKVHTPQELIDAYKEILPAGLEVIVQNIILGPTTNTVNLRAYFSQAGEPTALLTSRKIRQHPVEFGVGSMIESVDNPEVVELGLRFALGIGYRGFASIEFKRDDRDGLYKLIELNARYPSQVIHATDCGVNFPLIQYRDLAGMDPPSMKQPYKTGVRWFSAAGDLRSAWAHIRAGQLTPWDWMRSWAGARSFAVFAPDDLRPFLRYLASLPFEDQRRPLGTDLAPAPGASYTTAPAPPAG